MNHPNYDEFWKARNIRPHLKNIKPAVMTVGGWFDAENLFGALNTYKAIEQTNPGASSTLVMAPWFHGGWARSEGDFLGNVSFGSKTSLYYRESVEMPFFNCLLKDKCDRKLPEALVFETGSNQWRMYDHWPATNVEKKSLYLHSNGSLSFDPQADRSASALGGFDEYISDPNRPAPYINGTAIGMTREYMIDDQRFCCYQAGRSGLRNPGAPAERDRSWTNYRHTFCFHIRNRFGLRCKSDRRVPGRHSGP